MRRRQAARRVEGEGEMTGPRPAGRRWTHSEDSQILDMLEAGMTANAIARKLKRTLMAVYSRMNRLRKKTPAPPPRN